jgi:hypothetical protein
MSENRPEIQVKFQSYENSAFIVILHLAVTVNELTIFDINILFQGA